jgi:hypothetical protein
MASGRKPTPQLRVRAAAGGPLVEKRMFCFSKIVRTATLLPILIVTAASVLHAQGVISLAGIVRDSSGAVVGRADVSLLTAEQTIVKTTQTDDQGRFTLEGVPPGRYLLTVAFPGFSERRLAVTASTSGGKNLDVTLEPEGYRSEVTVTANPGLVQDTAAVAQPVNVIDAREIQERAKEVVAQVATGARRQLLRTAPVMAGVYVRGLTKQGQRVRRRRRSRPRPRAARTRSWI